MGKIRFSIPGLNLRYPYPLCKNNFSDQSCLTKYNSESIEGYGQNIFGHTDVLINDKYFFFVNANTCTL